MSEDMRLLALQRHARHAACMHHCSVECREADEQREGREPLPVLRLQRLRLHRIGAGKAPLVGVLAPVEPRHLKVALHRAEVVLSREAHDAAHVGPLAHHVPGEDHLVEGGAPVYLGEQLQELVEAALGVSDGRREHCALPAMNIAYN